MQISRFTIAIEKNIATIPNEGRIAVFNPDQSIDLGVLPIDRVQLVQGFKPDHGHFEQSGYDVQFSPTGEFVMAVVFLPRSKELAKAYVARAMEITNGGPVLVDGQKTDGIESIQKECKKVGTVGQVFSKAHGKLFTIISGDFSEWLDFAAEKTVAGDFITTAGVFSADGIDRGSEALAGAMKNLSGRVADLGAGWGYLAREILREEKVTECHLIEADQTALECAKRNIDDPRAQFLWDDATQFETDMPFDAVVCNPPFHVGRNADPSLGRAFIATAAKILKPRGTLWLVANRHLPYETALSEAFLEVEEVTGSSSFKIFCASNPRRLY